MVVQVRRDALRLIRQLDHSLACGRMALAWREGDRRKALPVEVAVGIGLHDFSWGIKDREPVWDPATGGPVSFLTIDDDERARMFREGLDREEAIDGTAALLASLHYSRFMQERDDPVFAAREAARRARLRARQPDARDEAWWLAAADLLRHFDDLSLWACLATPEVEQRPDWLTETRVGTSPDGTRRRLSWRGPGTLVLDPFPFARPLTLEIPCRDLPRRVYASAAELRAAWNAAEPSAHSVTLAPE